MGWMRKALLAASQSRRLEAQMQRRAFAQRAVARFLPGESLDDALTAAESLRALGLPALLTLLGENVTDGAEADRVARHYADALDRAAARGLDAHVSVKLTQLGLDLGVDAARARLEAIVHHAEARRSFAWVDMEDHTYTDRTLAVYRRVRESCACVGVCVQAYLHRTERDVHGLLALDSAVRLVKGAYREPARVAIPRKKHVDTAYLRLAGILLEAAKTGRARPAFGTHDLRLIEAIRLGADDLGVPPSLYEFEMLYGIQREAQARLAREGHRMRVLISYGSAWFPWFMRRLAERPANLWFVARNLFVR